MQEWIFQGQLFTRNEKVIWPKMPSSSAGARQKQRTGNKKTTIKAHTFLKKEGKKKKTNGRNTSQKGE